MSWFSASIAWAAGLTKLKDKTDPDHFCEQYFNYTGDKCNCNVLNVDDVANYTGLVFSVVSVKRGYFYVTLRCNIKVRIN